MTALPELSDRPRLKASRRRNRLVLPSASVNDDTSGVSYDELSFYFCNVDFGIRSNGNR